VRAVGEALVSGGIEPVPPLAPYVTVIEALTVSEKTHVPVSPWESLSLPDTV
jgi:hypothetical protein